jgi:starch-binding outer membrane protein, SusD/RagB family
MKMLKRVKYLLIMLLVIYSSQACKKYLDEKTDQKMVVPQTLRDAQALLDFYETQSASHGYFPNLSDDNYYLKESYFNGLSVNLRNTITWQEDVNTENVWSKFYTMVLTANVALETLEKNERTPLNETEWYNIKGMAHFWRAWSFFQLLQYYADPYEAGVADTKMGIPLRLSSNANIVSTRASLKESWQQVLKDYKLAALYLPVRPAYVTRPNRAAAFEGLALAQLHMANFTEAALYADSSLQLNNVLIDYNSLNAAAVNPFSMFNIEVNFPAYAVATSILSVNNHFIDSSLYASYHSNDLRKTLFFKSNGSGTAGFRGSYNGNTTSTTLFCGLTTAEAYLIRSEANARMGLKDSAIADINRLLTSRWKTGLFVPLTAGSNEAALGIVLQERRKEMVMRGSRWFDLRRLNTEAGRAVTIQRKLGTSFMLEPGSRRYTFYIPDKVISISGMLQNTR